MTYNLAIWEFDVTAIVVPSGNGIITGVTQNQGASVILTAPFSALRFDGWYENGSRLQALREIEVTTSGRTLEARFSQIPPSPPTSISYWGDITGTVGTPYHRVFSTNGTAPITWTHTWGELPSGLSLSGGILSGTPQQAGIFHFEIEARNAHGYVRREFAIGVLPPVGITISVMPLQGGTVSGVEVNHGETTLLTATPNAGWEFAGWYNESGERLDNELDNEHEFPVEAGVRSLEARFTQLAECGECNNIPCVCYTVPPEEAFTVTFVLNGGTHNCDVPLVQTVTLNDAAVTPDVTRDGWVHNAAQWLRIGAIITGGTGHITSADVTFLARHIAGHTGFVLQDTRVANLRGETRPADINDVTMLARWLVGYNFEDLLN
jgi:hypothetical protein